MGLSVCWNLTSVCDKNCEYCFRELKEEAQPLDINYQILENLKVLDVERITFSGGEPFLYPNILDLFKKTKEYGIACHVVTNGSALNENNIEEYLKYVDKISISCDSPREYINEKIGRGADSYTHAKEIIPIIRKYYDSYKLKISINTVITYDPKREYEELMYMVNALRNDIIQYDIDRWKIIRFYPLRGKAKDNRDLYWVPDDDFIEIKREYESNGPFLKVEVRDIKDLDNNLIVSPCGLLKKSSECDEEVISDLKPVTERSSERHV